MRLLALIISRLFDPIWVVPLILWLMTNQFGTGDIDQSFRLILMAINLGVPGGYVIWRFISKGKKDWDIKSLKDRARVFVIALVAQWMGAGYAYLSGHEMLAKMLFGLWLIGVIFAIITWFWKISIHAGCAMILAFIVYQAWGMRGSWIWLIPVWVSWSRVYLGKHTVGQVLGGMGLSGIGMGALLWG